MAMAWSELSLQEEERFALLEDSVRHVTEGLVQFQIPSCSRPPSSKLSHQLRYQHRAENVNVNAE